MRARILCCLLVLLSACEPATEPDPGRDPALDGGLAAQITFRAQRSEYRHGDTAVIVLRNGSNQTVGFNLCLSARELRRGDEWVRFEPLRLCAAVLDTLAPGGEALHREPITPEWQPGEHRMVTPIALMDARARREVFTPPFTVRP